MITLKNINLVGAYLNNTTFTGRELSYANFHGAQLNHTNFAGTLTSMILNYRMLIFRILTYVHLSRSTFYKVTGQNFYFEHARMERIDFSDVKFTLSQCDATGFVGCSLVAGDFYRANLESTFVI